MPKPAATKPAESTFPSVGIIERRIASGDSNVGRAIVVHLVNQPEPMDVRIINTATSGRFYQATQDLGWVPVEPKEVQGGLSGDMRELNGAVVMGESGKEMLMKMPARLRMRIQHAKEARLKRSMQSKAQFAERVQRSMERDAAQSDRPGAEALERQSEAVGKFHLEEFHVSKELVPVE